MAYLYFLLITLAVSVVAAFLYVKVVSAAAKIFPDFNAENLVFTVPILVCAPLLFLLRMLTAGQIDILFYPSKALLGGVLAGAAVIGACGIFKKINKFSFVVLAACCAICSYLLPENFVLYGLNLSPDYQRMAVAASWFLIALSCSILTLTDGLLSVFSIIFSLTILGFYVISCTSLMQLLSAAVILGIASGYMLFNWRPAQMKMNFSATLSYGFLLGFIAVGTSAEGMWLPVQIIMLYLYIALAVFLLQKISFIEGDDENEDKLVSCLKLLPLLIAIAFMQVYTETSKTLVIVAVMTVLWAKSKIGFNGKKKSFKEINQETIESIKTGLKDIRNFLDKK